MKRRRGCSGASSIDVSPGSVSRFCRRGPALFECIRSTSGPRHDHDDGPSFISDGRLNSLGITIYGVVSVSFMMLMYAFESRGRGFILAFSFGCILSSGYGFLAHAWPFGVVELIWAGIASHRWLTFTSGEIN